MPHADELYEDPAIAMLARRVTILEKRVDSLSPKAANGHPTRKTFRPPHLSEVVAEMRALNLSGDVAQAQAERFWHHFESVGWKVGAKGMKSWPSAVRVWVMRGLDSGQITLPAGKKPGRRVLPAS